MQDKINELDTKNMDIDATFTITGIALNQQFEGTLIHQYFNV